MSLSRQSAFVTMAIGSPVQGSLRTLRNIEEVASSTVPDQVDTSLEASETVSTVITSLYSLRHSVANKVIFFNRPLRPKRWEARRSQNQCAKFSSRATMAPTSQ